MKCNHCGSEWTVNPTISNSIKSCPFCGETFSLENESLCTAESVLATIYKQYGTEVLTDEKKLLSYFSDLAPHLLKEKRILSYFAECNGPQRVFAAINSPEGEQATCVKRIVKEMKEVLFVDEFASKLICNSFFSAVTGHQLVGIEIDPSDNDVPLDTKISIKKACPSGDKHPLNTDDVAHPIGIDNKVKQNIDTLDVPYIDELIKRYNLESRYITPTASSFYKHFSKAAKTYAPYAQNEGPLLMRDASIFGSAKTGFILTKKTIYYNGGFLVGKSNCKIENIKGVSALLTDDKKYYSVDLECLNTTYQIMFKITTFFTESKERAEQCVAFWKELLNLK